MVTQAQSCDLKELVQKFIPESIGREIEKATSSIYPLQNVFIRKVKILKAPKFDIGKLMEASYPFQITYRVETSLLATRGVHSPVFTVFKSNRNQTVSNGFLTFKTKTEPLKIKTEPNRTVINGLVPVWFYGLSFLDLLHWLRQQTVHYV